MDMTNPIAAAHQAEQAEGQSRDETSWELHVRQHVANARTSEASAAYWEARTMLVQGLAGPLLAATVLGTFTGVAAIVRWLRR